jgi:hypothetical protein
MAAAPATAAAPAAERFPPVTELGMASIGLVAAGVIWLASHLPKHASLVPSILCLVVALLLIAASFGLLLRHAAFAWWRFKQVFWWLFLANVIVSGMIVYAFVYDHTKGATLAVLTCLLAAYVVAVSLIPAYTVARYAERQSSSAT